MSALVVVETYFGNTRHIADVVADCLRADGVDTAVVMVEDAPTQLDAEIELLVVGAPTHNLGLSTVESRQTASAQTGQLVPRIGIREWIERVERLSVPPSSPYSTPAPAVRGWPGSAAAQASVLPALEGSRHCRPSDLLGSRDHRTAHSGGG